MHEPVAVREKPCFARKGALTENKSFLGRGSRVLILKSEDLPVIRTVDHEDLVSAE